jgi:DNA-3-methyladenine glycosylase
VKNSANQTGAGDLLPFRRLIRQSRLVPRSFYARPVIEVAPDLLGAILVHGRLAARIVETEAYLGVADLAAHSSKGITKRTQVIFGPPGHAYVYFIYGMYECLNLVAEPEGQAGCVLIRAVEPVCGIGEMRERRPGACKLEDLASGPGKLTRTLGITRELNGADVTRGDFSVRRLLQPEPFDVEVTPRIGITECADWPLRFLIAGNRFVSSRSRPRQSRDRQGALNKWHNAP